MYCNGCERPPWAYPCPDFVAAERIVHAADALAAEQERLAAECERYGLPVSLDALLRHIYNNRDAVYGAKDQLAEILTSQRDALAATHEKIRELLRESLEPLEIVTDRTATYPHEESATVTVLVKRALGLLSEKPTEPEETT